MRVALATTNLREGQDGMPLTHWQRIILGIGLLLTVLMGLFPPWVQTHYLPGPATRFTRNDAGYQWLGFPRHTGDCIPTPSVVQGLPMVPRSHSSTLPWERVYQMTPDEFREGLSRVPAHRLPEVFADTRRLLAQGRILGVTAEDLDRIEREFITTPHPPPPLIWTTPSCTFDIHWNRLLLQWAVVWGLVGGVGLLRARKPDTGL